MALDEKLQLMKKMIFDQESKIKQKLDKVSFNKFESDMKEMRVNFDQQFDIMSKSYQTFDARNKDN